MFGWSDAASQTCVPLLRHLLLFLFMPIPADGISIPSSYTAHLAPLSSAKLWNNVCNQAQERKLAETPYVVMFQAVNILSSNGGGISGECGERVQEAWEFVHPRSNVVLDAQGELTVDLYAALVLTDRQVYRFAPYEYA